MAKTTRSQTSNDPLATRKTLLLRLRNMDEDAWKEFTEIYRGYIASCAIGQGLRLDEVDRIVQDVFVELIRRTQDLEYREQRKSFRKWLSNLVRWRAKDLHAAEQRRRQLFPTDEDVDGEGVVDAVNSKDPHAEFIRNDFRREVMARALRRVRSQVEAKTFQVLDLLVIRGLDLAEVKQRTGMTTGAIYTAKSRAIAKLQAEVRRTMEDEEKPGVQGVGDGGSAGEIAPPISTG